MAVVPVPAAVLAYRLAESSRIGSLGKIVWSLESRSSEMTVVRWSLSRLPHRQSHVALRRDRPVLIPRVPIDLSLVVPPSSRTRIIREGHRLTRPPAIITIITIIITTTITQIITDITIIIIITISAVAISWILVRVPFSVTAVAQLRTTVQVHLIG